MLISSLYFVICFWLGVCVLLIVCFWFGVDVVLVVAVLCFA